ncbi:MAG TPA: hypothetical protein VIN59_09420 [Alphaproteobacteria bacterium]
MPFLGFLYDNSTLRDAFHDIKEIAEYVTTTRSSAIIPSEYKSEGQHRSGPTEEAMLGKIANIQASIASMVTIDSEYLFSGISLSAIGSASPKEKISAFDNTYINGCIRFTPEYWEKDFQKHASALFVYFDPSTAAMQIYAVPVNKLEDHPQTEDTLKAIEKLPNWIEGAQTRVFSEAMTAPLPEQAKHALSKHKGFYTIQHGMTRAEQSHITPAKDRPTRQQAKTMWLRGINPSLDAIFEKQAGNRMLVCFYQSPDQKGCIVGNNMNSESFRKATGLDITRKRDIQKYAKQVKSNLGLSSEEVVKFTEAMAKFQPTYATNLEARDKRALTTARLAPTATLQPSA